MKRIIINHIKQKNNEAQKEKMEKTKEKERNKKNKKKEKKTNLCGSHRTPGATWFRHQTFLISDAALRLIFSGRLI